MSVHRLDVSINNFAVLEFLKWFDIRESSNTRVWLLFPPQLSFWLPFTPFWDDINFLYKKTMLHLGIIGSELSFQWWYEKSLGGLLNSITIHEKTKFHYSHSVTVYAKQIQGEVRQVTIMCQWITQNYKDLLMLICHSQAR